MAGGQTIAVFWHTRKTENLTTQVAKEWGQLSAIGEVSPTENCNNATASPDIS